MKMEVTPGARPDSAVVYALLSGNESALWAMDGYDAAATVLLNRPLPPSTANVTTTSFAIRNSVLYVLTSDGIVTREPLTAAGLPSSGGGHSSSFNLTQLVYAARCQVSLALARPLNSSMPSRAVTRSSRVCSLFLDPPPRDDSSQTCGNRTTVRAMGEMSSITVDSQGTAYIFSGPRGGSGGTGMNVLYAVNASHSVVGDIRSSGTDPSGSITQQGWYGLRSMATWVDESSNKEYLIVLESGGPGRYMQYCLGLANDTKRCVNCARITEIWNNIESGSNSGWIYDPKTSDYGWVVKYRQWPRCSAGSNHGECDGSGRRLDRVLHRMCRHRARVDESRYSHPIKGGNLNRSMISFYENRVLHPSPFHLCKEHLH